MSRDQLLAALDANHQRRAQILSQAVRCRRGSWRFLELRSESKRLSEQADALLIQLKSIH